METQPRPSSLAQRTLSGLALVFGVLTLFSGGNVLFGPDAAQKMDGNYVDFVVWFNFIAGGVYVLAAVGLWLGVGWGAGLSALIALATAFVALGFACVVLRGTPYEMRTVGALAFRIVFWTGVAWRAYRAGHQQ